MTASWRDLAECKGMTALFFPGLGEPTSQAKAVCNHCPVKPECRTAGEHEHFGIWGGRSERERRMGRREGALHPGPDRQPITHGTLAGALTHRRRNEQPCLICRLAWNVYNAERQRESRARRAAS